MIVSALRDLFPLLGRQARIAAACLVLGSMVAGLLEAMLLVLVVSSALAVAQDSSALALNVPLLGALGLNPSSALALAGVAGLSILVLHLVVAWITARLSSGVLHAARGRSLHAFAHSSWERQAQDSEGALQETVSTLSSQSAVLAMHISVVVSSTLALGMLLASALVVDFAVTGAVVMVGALLFFGLRPVTRLTRARARHYVTLNSSFNEHVTQWSSLAMELRVFGVEAEELGRLAEGNEETSIAMARSRFATRAGSSLYRDVAILLLVLSVAALNALDVELISVGAVVLLILRTLNYAQIANGALQGAYEIAPNLEELRRRWSSLEAAAEPQGTDPVTRISSIDLQNVGYDYMPGRPGIDDVTLRLSAGEALGVIGPSGGGKSTLVQVLLRLRRPTRGMISVSDVPYETIDSASWRSLVALVPQEPKLFQGTVADNIAFFRAGFTSDDIRRAAAEAHVLADIERLPQGFATVLGPRGIGLSGGQKQRVAIARALLGHPQLLVLDEPTSALDVTSEQLLQETIEDLKTSVTLVIIAHRLTTLACCDRVLALDEGRVKAIGSLDEALAHVAFKRTIDVDAAASRQVKRSTV